MTPDRPHRPTPPLRSSIADVAWPFVATGFAAEMLALQRQFDASQWWSPEALRARQFEQLANLVAQATTIPFHAPRLHAAGIRPGRPISAQQWARVPILTRRDLQNQGERLHAPRTPPAHGRITDVATGGSTGVPVRVRKTALEGMFWNAVQVREELWHREDFGGHIARLRRVPIEMSPAQTAQARTPEGLTVRDWGAPCALIWHTGKLTLFEIARPIGEQVALLKRLDPEYILTPPSNLRLIVGHCRSDGVRLPKLRAAWTLSEVVDDGLRDDCRDVLGARIVHNYSCAEGGYIALQCPVNERHFHVMSETMLVEVVDSAGRPCRPGEVGRVLLTPLHNYAMPLLRYEIGDEAEVGGPCTRGRGLPVLTAIVGRTIDQLVMPDGSRRRAELRHYRLSRNPKVMEYQVVQRSLQRIEILLVTTVPLTADEEDALRALARDEVGDGFDIDLTRVDRIPRTAADKLRPFVSKVAGDDPVR